VSGHPRWCDPAACLAKPEPTNEQYSAPGPDGARVDWGSHRSRAVKLGATTLQLTQAVAPWPCDTYLNIADGVYPEAVHVALADVVDGLAALLGGLHVDPCADLGAHVGHGYLDAWASHACPGRDEPQ
jgi:hypothetical protein